MLISRKKAKRYLNDASLTDFWDAVREAKISPTDQKVLDAKFIQGMSIVEISMTYGYSEETVKRIISRSYDKIYRLLGF